MSVYFAERDGLIKIGCSMDAERRVRLGLKATLLAEIDEPDKTASYRAERQLHRLFDDEAAGREWFIPSARLLAFIDALPPVVRVVEPHPWMTARQVADYFQVSVSSVNNWVRRGYVRPVFRGPSPRSHFRFERSCIEQMAESTYASRVPA